MILFAAPVFSFNDSIDRYVIWGDWLCYDKGDYISVCGYFGYEENINIPSTINGKEVTELSYSGDSKNMSTGYEYYSFFVQKYDGGIEPRSDQTLTKHITVPDTVKKIDDLTFYGCENIETIDLPEGLVDIGDCAFTLCHSLNIREFPKSVKKIGKSAFLGAGITSLDLPQGLEYIGDSAFSAANLYEIEIPDSVKYIGEFAFYGNLQLKSVKLPNGIREIPIELFGACRSLESVNIPEGVKIIGDGAFSDCTSLKEIYIPKSVTRIYNSVFEDSHLMDINFVADRETVESIMDTDTLNSVMAAEISNAENYKINLHFGEKTEIKEIPPEKTREEKIKDIFMMTAIIFFALFLITVCLFAIQKIRSKPKAANTPSQQGNALTAINSEARCKHCGALSGKNAKYCYSCGHKIKNK